MTRGTRPRKNRIEVWCKDDELSQIRSNAQNARLSTSAFLRSLGKGYQPKSAFDSQSIDMLAKLHADQGRLGGLLKLWLSEKRGHGAPVHSVRSLLHQIESLQMDIAKLVMQEARHL